MVITKRTKIDVSKYREKFQQVRMKIDASTDITMPDKEILLMVYDQLLEGIDLDKLSTLINIPVVLIDLDYRSIYIRVKFRLAELIKCFKNIQDFEKLIQLFEKFGRESGLHVVRRERRGKLEGVELYFIQ